MKKLLLILFVLCNIVGCSIVEVKTSFEDVEIYSDINQEIFDNN